MIDRGNLIELFYGTQPKKFWRIGKRIRQELLTMKSLDGSYILCMYDTLDNDNLLGCPVHLVTEDKLELVYMFSDGTEKVFDLNLKEK